MREGRTAADAHLDALMYRMLGGLLLLGAGILLVLLLALLGLPRAAGTDLLVLPGAGGRYLIAATAVPVLGAGTLLLGLPGLLALALARRQARFRPAHRGGVRARSFRRPLMILLAGLTLLAIVLLRR